MMINNPRHTYLTALRRANKGSLPLFLRFWSLGGAPGGHIPFTWREQFARIRWTTAHGLLDTAMLQPPGGYIEEYDAHYAGIESGMLLLEDGGHRLLRKTYQTPAGPLSHTIRLTDDWIHGADVPLFSDYNVPRLAAPLIHDDRDVERLSYLLQPASTEQSAAYRQVGETLMSQAAAAGVAVDGGWFALGDSLLDLLGPDGLLEAQYEDPELLGALLDLLLTWENARLQHVLEAGSDAIVYMAWYEGTDFWTPPLWRRWIKPRIAQLITQTHAAGRPFRFIITKGYLPILDDLIEIGIDCLTGVDPIQDQIDLADFRRHVAGRISWMGGMNSAVMLAQWPAERIRREVEAVIEQVKGDPGVILFPVDALFDETPFAGAATLIQTWREATGLESDEELANLRLITEEES